MNNWNEFFDKITFTYYRSSLIQKDYIDTILKYVKEINAKTIMEIAGGSGYTSALIADLLRKENVVIQFTDINKEIVDHVISYFDLSNMVGSVIDSFNIPNGTYSDIIIHQGFLEHFQDNEIITLLKEQAKCCQLIIFDVPNGRRWAKIQEFGNERFLMPAEWCNLVEDAGLEIIECTGRRFTNSWKKWMPVVIQNSNWFRKHFGEATIIICKKYNEFR